MDAFGGSALFLAAGGPVCLSRAAALDEVSAVVPGEVIAADSSCLRGHGTFIDGQGGLSHPSPALLSVSTS